MLSPSKESEADDGVVSSTTSEMRTNPEEDAGNALFESLGLDLTDDEDENDQEKEKNEAKVLFSVFFVLQRSSHRQLGNRDYL